MYIAGFALTWAVLLHSARHLGPPVEHTSDGRVLDLRTRDTFQDRDAGMESLLETRPAMPEARPASPLDFTPMAAARNGNTSPSTTSIRAPEDQGVPGRSVFREIRLNGMLHHLFSVRDEWLRQVGARGPDNLGGASEQQVKEMRQRGLLPAL